MSALNLYQLEIQIKNAKATKKSEQISAKEASKNWVNLPDAERSNYEKNCKNIDHVVSLMKNLDEVKNNKKSKASTNVSSPKAESKTKTKDIMAEKPDKKEIKIEKKTKAAQVK